MADEARQYLQAAQEAEIRGDKPTAVELLKKAATIYKNAGNHQRALQMLRQARRLDGQRQDVADEVSRMEWIPESPLSDPEAIRRDEQEDDIALAPLIRAALVERGPTVADPKGNNWCSFCCRPGTEVGKLVAGPAGAFICGNCLDESYDLLGLEAGEDDDEDEIDLVGEVAARWRRDATSTVDESATGDPAVRAAMGDTARALKGSADTLDGPTPGLSNELFEAERLARAQAARDLSSTVDETTARGGAGERRVAAPVDGTDEVTERIGVSSRGGGRGVSGAVEALTAERGADGVSVTASDPPSAAARKLAEINARRATATAAPEAPPAEPAKAPERIACHGQSAAVGTLDAAMRSNTRRILLVGPEGSGKTTYLADLARRGLGRWTPLSELSRFTADEGQRLLIDGLDAATPEELIELEALLEEEPQRPVILATRGQAPAPAITLKGEDQSLQLHSAEALRALLPETLAQQIQQVASFSAHAEGDLLELARRLASRRAGELELSDEALQALVKEALRTGRGGAELEALIARIPSGSWKIDAPADKKPESKRKKKGKE
jgi:hypothetical protein